MDRYTDFIGMGGGVTIIFKHSLGDANVKNHWSKPWVVNLNGYRDQEINAHELGGLSVRQ